MSLFHNLGNLLNCHVIFAEGTITQVEAGAEVKCMDNTKLFFMPVICAFYFSPMFLKLPRELNYSGKESHRSLWW